MTVDIGTAPADRDLNAALRSRSAELDGGGPRNLIRGEWIAPRGAASEGQFDPSTGEQIGELRYSSRDDFDEAVRSAGEVQTSWSRSSVDERLDPLSVLTRLIQSQRSTLVPLIAAEVGKVLAEADDEVDLALAFLRELSEPDQWGRPGTVDADASMAPLGVAAGIALYHYPLLSPLWMTIPALCAGNGYVLRPCTWSAVTGVRVGQLLEAAGYPDGLINVVHGSAEIVDYMLRHPGVSAISYVGSGPGARHMVEHGTRHGKRVDAIEAVRQVHVVAEGADVAAAASSISRRAFGLAGQRWLGGCSVIVDDPTATDLVEALVDEATNRVVGPSTDRRTTMGPVVRSARQRELIRRVAEAGDSCQVRVDGTAACERPGFFFGPTIVDGVSADSPLWTEEMPGPIVSVTRAGPDDRVALLRRSPHRLLVAGHGLPNPLVPRSDARRRVGAGRMEALAGGDDGGAGPSWFQALGTGAWTAESVRFFTR